MAFETYRIRLEEKVGDECFDTGASTTCIDYEEAIRRTEHIAMAFPAKFDIVLERYRVHPNNAVELLRLMGDFDG